MINRHKYKNIEWIDMESPRDDELAVIAQEYHLHPITQEELRHPSERAKVDSYGKYIYLIFHFPRYKRGGNREAMQEVDFVIGKNFIITSHYEPINPLLDVSKNLETRSILDKSESLENSGFIFHQIMKTLYESLERELDNVRKDLTHAEAEVFIGNEDKMVQVLSQINKGLIDFRHPLKIHSEILESLDSKEEKLFGPSHEHYTQIVLGEYKKAWSRLENDRDLLMDLRETNDSLFSAKTNSIMKNLTIMSFLTFPLSLMTGIFSMNTSNTPLAGLENGFWVILGIMGVTIILMITFFKTKKWL